MVMSLHLVLFGLLAEARGIHWPCSYAHAKAFWEAECHGEKSVGSDHTQVAG